MKTKFTTFTYIVPTNLVHFGLKHKFNGQMAVFKSYFKAGFHFLDYKVDSLLIFKLYDYIIFEFKSLFYFLFSASIYVRYDPKAIFTNFYVVLFACFKRIGLEHNTKFTHSLSSLDRRFERILHCFWFFLFKYLPVAHFCVTDDISTYLVDSGYSSGSIFSFCNGFFPYDESDLICLSTDQYSKLSSFVSNFNKVGVFVGSGYI